MDLEKIKKILIPYLEAHQLELYDIAFVKEYGYLILRVLIDCENGVDIDTLAECNEFLSAQLDELDSDMPEYMLEVSSPGAEKELRTLEEVQNNIGKYVHVEIPSMIYEGILKDVVEENVFVYFNAKGRFKTIQIPYQEIKLIRLAVKI